MLLQGAFCHQTWASRGYQVPEMCTPAAARGRPWRVVLDKNQRRGILASIHAIEDTLTSHINGHEAFSTGNVYLSEGTAGIALFFSYLQASGLARKRELAFDCLAGPIEALAVRPMTSSFYGGFTGIAWVAHHLNTLIGGSAYEFGDDVDFALEQHLRQSPWNYHYDLIHGLVGLGVYCLERGSSPAAMRCLGLIVQRLSELAEASGDGLRWHTPPALLAPHQKEKYPQGYDNLGVAHGVPGIVALLGKIHGVGVSQRETGRLLEGAVKWLLRQRLPDAAESSFAALHVAGRQPESSRLAWCYGDAGLATALLLAARCVGEQSWEREALAIAKRAAARDPKISGVMDPCFCHGSSGLAHIFNRLFQATHDEVFAMASRYWIERTLQFCTPGDGPAGYLVKTSDADGRSAFRARYGVLMGIAGIGLSLIASISTVEPNWDRIFLLDIPSLPAS